MGESCYGRSFVTIYGTFLVENMSEGEEVRKECEFDEPKKFVIITCVMVGDAAQMKTTFQCIQTEKSGQIEALAEVCKLRWYTPSLQI